MGRISDAFKWGGVAEFAASLYKFRLLMGRLQGTYPQPLRPQTCTSSPDNTLRGIEENRCHLQDSGSVRDVSIHAAS